MANKALYILGFERIFSPTYQGNDLMNFYGSYFCRIKELHNKGMIRTIRYESSLSGGLHYVFIGTVTDDINAIPPDMTAWSLSDNTWERYGYRDQQMLLSSQNIHWLWKSGTDGHGISHVMGDFALLEEVASETQDFTRSDYRITANAYTDPSREIADGDAVSLTAYDAAWPEQFKEYKCWLTSYLSPDIALRVEHFGSTAIPGMPAKPIVDVMVEIPATDEARSRILSCFNHEAWEYWWYDDHMTFIQRDGFMGKRTYHIHMAPMHHPLWNKLAFKDYLIAHPDAAARYAELKTGLAASMSNDRERYTQAKGDFVWEMTDKALEWKKCFTS